MKLTLDYSICSISYHRASRQTSVVIMNNETGEIFVGTARKHPDDEMKMHLGTDLALNRALQQAIKTALKDEEEIIIRHTDR